MGIKVEEHEDPYGPVSQVDCKQADPQQVHSKQTNRRKHMKSFTGPAFIGASSSAVSSIGADFGVDSGCTDYEADELKKVYLVYWNSSEGGYNPQSGVIGVYSTLQEAVAVAKEYNNTAYEEGDMWDYGSVEEWEISGQSGVTVYPVQSQYTNNQTERHVPL